MGDNGKLYPSMTQEMVEAYRSSLLAEVDYFFPNQTECQ
jgi:pyridoxal/pyridoxine/pyridoxamine kinase